MSVRWNKIDGKIEQIEIKRITMDAVLDAIWDNHKPKIVIQDRDFEIDIDLRPFIHNIGDHGRVLFLAGEYNELKNVLRRYWSLTFIPEITVEIAKSSLNKFCLRQKIVGNKDDKTNDLGLMKIVSDINSSFEYDKVVVGCDRDNLELQFLNSQVHKEVRPGDIVDCGLFLSVNGKVHLAPGINQLKCSNGLTERFFILQGQDYRVTSEYLDRAISLANWFSKQSDRKITDMREVSVILSNYPAWVSNKFWKSWAEKIGLEELTWYDVIYDITQIMNRTLSPIRYNVLAISEDVKKSENEGHRCPTCSTHIS